MRKQKNRLKKVREDFFKAFNGRKRLTDLMTDIGHMSINQKEALTKQKIKNHTLQIKN